jgi:hypothetical protein
MSCYICETCENEFKSKMSLRKHNCIKKILPIYDLVSDIQQEIQSFKIDYQYQLEMMKSEQELCFDRISQLLNNIKLKLLSND